jgi:DNA-binding HxlR family transcriptional regulator
MPTSRSYGDACAIARALDVVGERWALLVVRELLLGPQRFSDLRRALPGASSNLVADRLRELEGRGVIGRRKLPAPASSRVYELTEWGRDLEPILLALGDWAIHVPLPPAPSSLSATSVVLFLRSSARPDPQAPPATCRLELDDRVWTIRAEAGRLHVQPGEPASPDASLRADPATFNALLDASREFDTAVSDGSVVASGDLSALRRLVQAVTAPAPRRRPGLPDRPGLRRGRGAGGR